MQEPGIIGNIYQQICAIENKPAGEIANRVFKTNQWTDPYVTVRQAKNCVIPAGIEITRHPPACYCGKNRKRMTQWNVFTKGDQMNLAINLHLLRRARNQCSSVEITSIPHVKRSEEQIFSG